jgi:hypothetical protein
VAWYSHACRVGVSEFPLEVWGLQHSPVSVTLADFMNAVRSALGPGITPIVSGAMLIGFFAPFRPEFRFLFHWWLLAVVIFWVIAGRGFVMHSWYGLPIAPVAAALAGRACDLVANALEKTTGSRLLSLSTVGACFVGMAFFSWGYSYPHYTSWANPYREAGLEVRKMASPGDLVTFADTGDPTGIYYSGRKGCLFYAPADNDRAIQQLNDLRNEGVRYLVFTRYARWWLNDLPDFRRHLESAHTRVVEQGDYTVFHLAPPDPSVRLTRVRSGAGSGRAAGQSDTRCGCTAFGFECPSTEPSPLRRAR